ncbi:MAG: nucleotidyl transferase AbiEii/AbiGii toxin family protein [Candidatus Omnitrophota bacterium]
MNTLKGKGILTPLQKNLLVEFGKVKEAALFYLTGGTALAEFYLGHRHSYDLDFFTRETGLIVPFVRVLEEKLLQEGYPFSVTRRFESFAELEVKKEGESVRLHLAYDSPFHFEEPQISEYGVKINSYNDLITDKLLTYFGRWKHRDAIDLFFILGTEPMENLIGLAKQKDPGFDLYWFAIALKEADKFPDEITQWPVDMVAEINAGELKSKFLDLAHEIMDRINLLD